MFCQHCGSKLSGSEAFCPKCGAAVARSGAPHPSGDGSAYTLTIVRPNQFYLVNPAINIDVDGLHSCKIANDSTIQIPIAAGCHTLSFSASMRNKVVSLSVSRDLTLTVKWDRITGSINVEEGA